MADRSFRDDVAEALKLLGVERLILAVHDASFPSTSDEEIGRGSPCTAGARLFIKYISSLGFTAIQMGPQGKTTLFNPSPYDGTTFSRNPLSISLKDLAYEPEWRGLLDKALLQQLVQQCPDHDTSGAIRYRHAWHSIQKAMRNVFDQFKHKQDELQELSESLQAWLKQQRSIAGDWLLRDAIFEVLTIEHGTDDWRQWPKLDKQLFCAEPDQREQVDERIRSLTKTYAEDIQFYDFCQFVVHCQHDKMRVEAQDAGLDVFGDLQIGYSLRDEWSRAELFMPGYLVGAPPSRTNPDGQPWGYPVLDPNKYFESEPSDQSNKQYGPSLKFLSDRATKMFDEFDGIRIDHPHGMVCPWVYDSTNPDALQAVQNGARLFSSPAVPNHEELAKIAIARPEQVTKNPYIHRYADDWVTDLDDDQVERYSTQIDCLLSVAPPYEKQNIFCEVLSTCPYPLKRVMERHSLGRFRVTQKADMANQDDVYRSENAKPDDVIMVGTHDTRPLKAVVDDWFKTSEKDRRAGYLAERLEPNPDNRAKFADTLAMLRTRMCQAMFADLFASPAKNISIFFADLLGMKEVYNEPGTVNDTNWMLRIPDNFADIHRNRCQRGEAFSMAGVLTMALKARFPDSDPGVVDLVDRLNSYEASNLPRATWS